MQSRNLQSVNDPAQIDPSRPVEIALAEVSLEIQYLEASLADLTSRLSPILTPEFSERGDGSKEDNAALSVSPYAERATAMASQIRRARMSLENLLRRAEVG